MRKKWGKIFYPTLQKCNVKEIERKNIHSHYKHCFLHFATASHSIFFPFIFQYFYFPKSSSGRFSREESREPRGEFTGVHKSDWPSLYSFINCLVKYAFISGLLISNPLGVLNGNPAPGVAGRLLEGVLYGQGLTMAAVASETS